MVDATTVDATTRAPRLLDAEAIARPRQQRFRTRRVALRLGGTVRVLDFTDAAPAGTVTDLRAAPGTGRHHAAMSGALRRRDR